MESSMAATPESPNRVTLGLMDGRSLSGILPKFSPLMAQLLFDPDTPSGEKPRRMLLARDEIAFVGFHRQPNQTQHPQMRGMVPLKVKTVGQILFEVVSLIGADNQVGFYGYPIDPTHLFYRIFFYGPGVRQRERMEPLGELLMGEGVIDRVDLDRAIAVQQAERSKPLGQILVEQNKVAADKVEEAVSIQVRKRMRLGEVLVEAGLVKPEDIEEALKEQQKKRGKKLGDILIEMGVVDEVHIATALALKFHLPFVDLDEYPIDPKVLDRVAHRIVHKFGILPVREDERTLTIAISDPLATGYYDVLRFQVKKAIKEVVATKTQIEAKLVELLGAGAEDDADIDALAEDLVLEHGISAQDEPLNEFLLKRGADEAPIVKLVNQLIWEGLSSRASDIHLLPQEKGLVVAYRVNGDLIHDRLLDKRIQAQVVSRIKIIAGMDISERRLPQDGRLLLRRPKGAPVEFRVSAIPNVFGESIVMRVLNKEMAVDLHSLGLRPEDEARMVDLSQRPFGLILATGPTGSGKSTTLFAVLQGVVDRPVHVISIEDPVESQIEGVNQVQVNAKIGMTFARILRNILRHDPDVIMVGEMRDQETASIGVEAALTGHLMLSTLHTNTAADTIVRLIDLGLPTYLIAPALLGIISQSLVKKLCPDCRTQIDPDDDIFDILQGLGLPCPPPLWQAGKGCPTCHDSGYAGRAMIYEFLEITPPVRQAIKEGKMGKELEEVAVAGGMLLKRQHALELARDGVMARDELLRILL